MKPISRKVSCNCMGNVNGVCCVKNCKGAIIRLQLAQSTATAEDMAKIYEMYAQTFKEEFG